MPAFAVLAQASAQQPGIAQWLLLWGVIAVIFYVLLIMPQRRRQKAHEKMIQELGPGDKIVTNGGLVGTITKVEADRMRVKLGPQVEVTLMRTHVAGKSQEESQ